MARGDRLFHSGRTFGSLLISSPQGHSGKTIVTVGLCKLLSEQGLLIQPFKKGPDYIDPSWLTIAAGRDCRNLDLFLIPEDRLIHNFELACDEADLAIVEGAMGLYDGLDDVGTSAEISRLFNIPILFVVNTTRMTGSIAPMVRGFQEFKPDIHIAGVILNNTSGPRHEKKLIEAVEKHCQIPVVGSIPRDINLKIPERHLGLIPSSETDEAESVVELISRRLGPYLDLHRILAIAREFGPPHLNPLPRGARENNEFPLLPGEREKGEYTLLKGESGEREYTLPQGEGKKKEYTLLKGEREKGEYTLPQGERSLFLTPRPSGERVEVRGNVTPKIKIGVLRDHVFNFYYPENLEALKEAGTDLVFINSQRDRLPEVDGLYIGGGFPEFFLEDLEANRSLRQDIAEAVEYGLPVYAECAGLMYLCRRIHWQGRSHEMVGTIPAEVEISQRPEGHGYVLAEVTEENPFLPIGLTIRGHEFHHSRLSVKNRINFAYKIKRGHGIDGKRDGIFYKNLFASYMHLHALGTPLWAEAFVSLARRQRKTSLKTSYKESSKKLSRFLK
jgi:cobyrinic acid a,c-diamide synthase